MFGADGSGDVLPDRLDHPAWRVAVAPFLGYAGILAAILVALFVVPFLLFRALG